MKKLPQILGVSTLLALALWNLACAGSSQTASAQLMSKITSPAPSVAAPQATPDDNVPRIKAEEAIKLVQAGNAIVVDTRDAGSFENMHVKGALNIPFQTFQDGKHQKLPKDKQLIFYCT